MTDMRPVTCQECGWKGTVGRCEPIAPRYLPERVPAGDVMPAGDCPVEGCGGAAMLNQREPAAGPRMQPVCNTCGGTGVQVDAWASWDTHAQRWELHSVYEAAAICADCDVECAYAMKPLAEAE